MKQIALPLAFLLVFLLPSRRLAAQTPVQDSLVVVDLYNSTNGPNWTNHTNWLTSAPISTWYGVFLDYSTLQVVLLSLDNNNLVGTLPASMGNFTAQGIFLSFQNNRLSGSLPSSLTNLPGGAYINTLKLAHNQLSGPIPNFPQLPPLLLDISFNDFTFADLEPYITSGQANSHSSGLSDTTQADLPLIQNGNTLSIAVGGTLSNNTYTWYQNGTVVATNTGDSTYNMTSPGVYSVAVTNAVVPSLTLYSIQNTNTQDSLALVDLYNSTAGANWLKNANWATSAPMSTWNGLVTRFGRVQQVYLSYNNLAGTLPSSMSNLTGMTLLDLSSNQLSGAIPSTFGSLQSLEYLSLASNQLTGPIPSTLSNLSNLVGLSFYSNQLTGSIPSSLGTLPQLKSLVLGNNQLSGNIPAALGNISTLIELSLSNNLLTDTIPASLGYLNNLTDLSLNDNQLTGHIPVIHGRPANLLDINLYDNNLSGTIPDSICFLPSLAHLLIYNNQLTGSLPDSIGSDVNLLEIRVENNQLSGALPSSISNLPYLDSVNISGNKYDFLALAQPITFPSYTRFVYAPQQNIPLTRVEANLSVSTGGNSAHSTYTLFKDGVSIATQTGDSLFTIGGLGNYNIVTTNTDAPLLTLYSDTLKLGLVLPDSTVTTTQTISGSTAADIDTSIFRIVTLTPGTGANALTGSVTALETVDSAIQTFNGAPYVERHYDITPALNPTTSTATVTLYFTQSDFDTYNTYVTTHNIGVPLLPTGGVDNGNILITQYHGSFTGTSSPANYSQGSEVIHPTVAWDAIDSWWTVSFPVSGFSGFFLGTGSNPLPLTLLQFTGTPQGYTVNLQWQTTDEQNTKQFIIQRSADGNVFDPIGAVAAKNTTGQNQYGFTDNHPFTGNNFYRLKMTDLDGAFTYSPVVLVRLDAVTLTSFAYPNPAHTITSLLFNSGTANKYSIEITDLSGKKLNEIVGTTVPGLNKVDIDVHGYAAGIYTITIIDEEYGRRSLQLSKE